MRFPSRSAARANGEAGFALAVAMFTLAVIGALVAGSFLPGRLEQQSGYNVTYASQAGEAAEAGLADAVATLNAAALEPLVSGGAALDLGTMTAGEMITVHTTVARLTSRVFIVRSHGTRHDASGAELAGRTLGLFVRIASTAVSTPEDAAVPAAGPLVERSWMRLD
jgi:Tfp pilus assembly protein PilX